MYVLVDNKKIAKNAIMLTIRMVIVVLVGLYTSRIVFNALGVEDYGLYGLIGGIIGMTSFLNSSMAGATSRFITYELGIGNDENLKSVFSTSVVIHILIALIAIILGETFGLWILNNKLVIPDGSRFAANVVYQLSILSIVVNFTQVPYTAAIIAHEKMQIYAYFEIVNVLIKLGIAYLLLLSPSSRLILYSSLQLCATVISAAFYRYYCIKNFRESKFRMNIHRETAKKMFAFSGYDLYGSLSVMVYTQGVPIILNLFYGVISNAAASIATTISNILNGFSRSVIVAFKPQITIQYANKNFSAMEGVMQRSIQFTVLLFSVLSVPFLIETPRILSIWLGEVPKYSVVLIRLIILVTYIDYIIINLNSGIHATGNIKRISFISGSLYLVCPFIAYIFMRFGSPVYTPYIVNGVLMLIVVVFAHIIIKKQIPEFAINKYVKTISKTYGCILISIVLVYFIRMYAYGFMNSISYGDFIKSLLALILVFVTGLVVVGFLSYSVAIDKNERAYIIELINRRLNKILLRKSSNS